MGTDAYESNASLCLQELAAPREEEARSAEASGSGIPGTAVAGAEAVALKVEPTYSLPPAAAASDDAGFNGDGWCLICAMKGLRLARVQNCCIVGDEPIAVVSPSPPPPLHAASRVRRRRIVSSSWSGVCRKLCDDVTCGMDDAEDVAAAAGGGGDKTEGGDIAMLLAEGLANRPPPSPAAAGHGGSLASPLPASCSLPTKLPRRPPGSSAFMGDRMSVAAAAPPAGGRSGVAVRLGSLVETGAIGERGGSMDVATW